MVSDEEVVLTRIGVSITDPPYWAGKRGSGLAIQQLLARAETGMQ